MKEVFDVRYHPSIRNKADHSCTLLTIMYILSDLIQTRNDFYSLVNSVQKLSTTGSEPKSGTTHKWLFQEVPIKAQIS